MIKVSSGSIVAAAAVALVGVFLFRSRGIFGNISSVVVESLDVANDRNFINRAFNYVYTGAGVLRDPETTNLGFDIHRAQVATTGFLNSDRNPLRPVGQAIGSFLFKLFN